MLWKVTTNNVSEITYNPDHLDNNGLNCQRNNLELVSFNENLRRKRCLRRTDAGLEFRAGQRDLRKKFTTC